MKISPISVSDDVRLLWAPARVYAELVGIATTGAWGALIARLALLALLLGTTLTLSAIGRVTLVDILETSLAWSFVLVIQLIAAMILIRRPPPTVRLPRALDLLFAGHVPWSLWLLAMSGLVLLTDNADLGFAAAVGLIPAIWTATIMSAFCRVVLEMTREEARRRILAHQIFIWSFAFVYIFFASGLWPRFLGVIGQ